jgi:hypothetical protein
MSRILNVPQAAGALKGSSADTMIRRTLMCGQYAMCQFCACKNEIARGPFYKICKQVFVPDAVPADSLSSTRGIEYNP